MNQLKENKEIEELEKIMFSAFHEVLERYTPKKPKGNVGRTVSLAVGGWVIAQTIAKFQPKIVSLKKKWEEEWELSRGEEMARNLQVKNEEYQEELARELKRKWEEEAIGGFAEWYNGEILFQTRKHIQEHKMIPLKKVKQYLSTLGDKE